MHQCQVFSCRGTHAGKIGFMIWLGKFIYTEASLVVQANDMISKMEKMSERKKIDKYQDNIL